MAINLHKIFSQIPFTNWERLSVIRVVFLHKHIFNFYVLLLLLNVGDLSIQNPGILSLYEFVWLALYVLMFALNC